MEMEWLWIGLSLVAAGGVGFAFFRGRARPSPPAPLETPSPAAPDSAQKSDGPGATATPISGAPADASPQGLVKGLGRSRGGLLSKLSGFLSRSGADAFQGSDWETIEEALLAGDVGIRTVQGMVESVRDRFRADGHTTLRDALVQEGEKMLSSKGFGFELKTEPRPFVISVVGVNGAGKTTTIGKLAQRFSSDGKSVLMGAGDTFRAAAIGQLKVWAERTGAQFVTGREGADPGAVAFDSVSAAKARGVDVVLLDTAGRLHTKSNLMDELKKIDRVIKKVIPEAPHETWLVLDGTAGQNNVVQAKEFQKALPLTGVIITKLDGTAKGGALLTIASELGLPVRFIGVGESAADLVPFEPRPFLEALLGGETTPASV